MALSRDVVIRLLGDADSAVKAQREAAKAAEVTVAQYRRAEREHARMQAAQETAARKQREAMSTVGQGALALGATVGVGIGMAIKSAVSWESAWAGVRKTVNATPAELGRLEKGLRGLARELPATHEEIAAVAEAAGQLGVQTDSIVDFTRTMVNLGETTNLSADEAATSIAQMMNVMQTAADDVERLGSTLVALGNAGASTEADIMSMAQRLSGAGQLIGASEADVLALANAMSSVGIKAELGGGAMSRVMQKIYSAVQTGGDAVAGFADVAGMSADEFATAFETEPVRAIDAFVQGLNTVEESGGNVITTLGELGIKGTENLQVMLQLKGAGDLLGDSLDLGSKAWEQNNALVLEAAKRYDTTASKMEIAKNNINDAGIEIGEVFLPILSDLAEGVADVAGWFADLPDGVQTLIGGFGGLAAVVGVSGGAFLLLAPKVIDTYKAVHTLAETSPKAASALGKLGKAAGVATAVTILGTAIGALQKAMAPTELSMEEATSALLDMGDTTAVLDERFRKLGTVDDEIDGVKGAAERLTDPGLLDRFNDFGGSLLNVASFGTAGSDEGAESRAAIIKDFNALGDSLALMVQNGNADLAAQQFETLKEQWVAGGGSVEQLLAVMPAYDEALKGVDNDQRAAAESATQQAQQAQVLAQNLELTYGSIEGYAAALGLGEEETQALVEATESLGETLAAFVDPLAAYTQYMEDASAAEQAKAQATADNTEDMSDSWEDYVKDAKFSFDTYMEYLRDQVKAQDDWHVNMLKLAGRVSEGTLAELEAMGVEGAPLVAELVKKSDKELAEFDDITQKRTKDATDAMATELTLAQPVLAQVAAKAGQKTADALAEKLAKGKTTVAQIARDYGVELAGGLNPILTSLGKRPISMTGSRFDDNTPGHATGGYISGPGGPSDDLIPARLSNGEYVIQAKAVRRIGRDRLDMLNQGRLPESPGFATGGFVSTGDVPKPPGAGPFGGVIGTALETVTERMYDEVVEYVKKMGVGGPGVQNALRWARTQVGKPYIWGGVGPDGYDCSGFMSAITNIIRGHSPYARVGSTASFPWAGFAPGIMGGFSVGSTANAGGGIGHMAGRLGGVNVESYGGHGPAVGSGARGPDDSLFGTRAHLVGSYKTGTSYVPRDGLAYVHKGEAVVPAEQNRSWMTSPTSPISRTGGGGPVVVNVNGARIVGRLEVDTDGFATLVDGMLEGALVSVENRGRYS